MKKINVKTFNATFGREYQDGQPKLSIELYGDTPKGHPVKVTTHMDFDWLPFVMPGLRAAWAKEKESRLLGISEIDSAVR